MFNEILKISQIAKPRSLKDVLCHVVEEVGEIATMINKPDAEYKESLTHEIADAIQCLVDLQYIYTYQDSGNPLTPKGVIAFRAEMELKRALVEKNDKWKRMVD